MSQAEKHKSDNIAWQQGEVSRDDREKINRHRGAIVWLTGLSGSGKSTIAIELEKVLHQKNKRCYRLDGDNFRFGLSSDLGFSVEDRDENIRRVGETAKLFADAGLIVVTGFISPYFHERDRVRNSVARQGDFIEVYLNCPVEECEKRDVKGLYAKARAGKIKDFTGISAPYEIPQKPEIILDSVNETVEECVQQVAEYLEQKGYLNKG